MQPMAMVFQRSDGQWKLAAAVNRPARGWPALCTKARRRARRRLAAADYAPELARVLTHATTGSAETTATAAPFAVNDFFAGSGSISLGRQADRAGPARRGELHPGLHHDREPDARAAAGRRARLSG